MAVFDWALCNIYVCYNTQRDGYYESYLRSVSCLRYKSKSMNYGLENCGFEVLIRTRIGVCVEQDTAQINLYIGPKCWLSTSKAVVVNMMCIYSLRMQASRVF
jgi:hypothetical protein